MLNSQDIFTRTSQQSTSDCLLPIPNIIGQQNGANAILFGIRQMLIVPTTSLSNRPIIAIVGCLALYTLNISIPETKHNIYFQS